MKAVWNVYKTFNYLKYVGVFISAVSVMGMMFVISYDVFMRSLFSQSIRGGFEIVQNYFLPLVVFPSLAYIYSSGVLPKMDILLEKFGLKVRKILTYSILAIELFILILIVQFSWDFAVTELGRKTAFSAGGSMYPLYPIFFFIPVAFFMVIVETIFVIIRNIELGRPTLTVQEKESEIELD